MATRTYTPSLAPFANGINPEHLGALIDTALSRSGTVVTYVLSGGVLTISVTHAALTAADDAAINAVFAAYVYDPNFQTAAQTAANRANALALVGTVDPLAKVLRAVAAVLVDEVNALRTAYPIPVASIARTLTTATATTVWPHGLVGTVTLTIAGADLLGYNGTVTATVTGASTFTYPVSGLLTSPALGSIVAFPVTAVPVPRTIAQVMAAIQAKITAGVVDVSP
jgi:hypothetical protein